MRFWAMQRGPGPEGVALPFAVLTAALAGMVVSSILAFLAISLRASQIVSGLALTIFCGGLGLASYLGNDLGLADVPPKHQFSDIDVFGLKDVPIAGPVLFHQSALVYLSWLFVLLISLYLMRTRIGLNTRAIGEAPGAADAMGISVPRYRYAHVLAGGALAGIGGACYSLAITPGWTDGDSLVGGAGWMRALVIFAFWRPGLCLVGAYLYGGLSGGLPSALQAHGYKIKPEVLNALPYIMTIVVLVIVSTGLGRRRLGAPAALGIPYVREER
jgi:simple sugar transport system permease protein